MKCDVILCGVGGQGVLSVAAVITMAATEEGLTVRQSEVHGMAQRGGAVLAHLRISDEEIKGDLIGRGCADLILSVEPLESLRYLDYLAEDGLLVTSSDPFVNIPDYPELDSVYKMIKEVSASRLIPAKELAKKAENNRAVNMVMVGAASVRLPVSDKSVKAAINTLFSKKGQDIVDKNYKAFELGRDAE